MSIGTHLRQFICSLRGHDELLHFEKGRLSLQCVSCGYQSPGWEVKRASAAAGPDAAIAAPRRSSVVRMPLVGHRRVA
jgi:hypothetical protein